MAASFDKPVSSGEARAKPSKRSSVVTCPPSTGFKGASSLRQSRRDKHGELLGAARRLSRANRPFGIAPQSSDEFVLAEEWWQPSVGRRTDLSEQAGTFYLAATLPVLAGSTVARRYRPAHLLLLLSCLPRRQPAAQVPGPVGAKRRSAKRVGFPQPLNLRGATTLLATACVERRAYSERLLVWTYAPVPNDRDRTSSFVASSLHKSIWFHHSKLFLHGWIRCSGLSPRGRSCYHAKWRVVYAKWQMQRG